VSAVSGPWAATLDEGRTHDVTQLRTNISTTPVKDTHRQQNIDDGQASLQTDF
jgi:hypothetical protein